MKCVNAHSTGAGKARSGVVETGSTAVLATRSGRKCFCTKRENIRASILGPCTSADGTRSIRGHASKAGRPAAAPLPTALSNNLPSGTTDKEGMNAFCMMYGWKETRQGVGKLDTRP